MAKDYAKKKQASGKRKKATARAPARKSGSRANDSKGSGGLRIYFAGVLTGLGLSFLAYLATLPEERAPNPAGQTDTQAIAEKDSATPAPRPRFEFYTRLPEQTFEVDVEEQPSGVEPAPDVQNPAAVADMYVLQAGSFRQKEDADRRRAELLLLGLEPQIEASTADNGRWHRVYLGPFETRSEASRARSLTANQGIDTLLLKRPSP